MMVVPTYLGPSRIEGVGLFAATAIPAGTLIWQLSDKLDRLLTMPEIARMPALQRQFVQRYGYPHMTRKGVIVLEFDNGRFMNHCHMPNTDFHDPERGWTTCDIAADEELTCDYSEFDPSFVIQPGFAVAGETFWQTAASHGRLDPVVN